MSDNFKYIIPAQLEKSKDGDWKIKGLASTERVDRQGEIIMQKGVDLSPVDEKRAILNWDHLKGPENTIGIIKGYQHTPEGLYIEGSLFKNHTKAKAVKEILDSLDEDSKNLVGLSVEGRIMERDPANPKLIKKCQINAVAVTLSPVNPDTYVGLAKSMSAAEIEFNATEQESTKTEDAETPLFTAEQVVNMMQKALGVSVASSEGMAPADKTQGDALTQSTMKDEDDDKNRHKKKKLKKLTKSEYTDNMSKILNKLQELYPMASRNDIWECMKERLYNNYFEIK